MKRFSIKLLESDHPDQFRPPINSFISFAILSDSKQCTKCPQSSSINVAFGMSDT